MLAQQKNPRYSAAIECSGSARDLYVGARHVRGRVLRRLLGLPTAHVQRQACGKNPASVVLLANLCPCERRQHKDHIHASTRGNIHALEARKRPAWLPWVLGLVVGDVQLRHFGAVDATRVGEGDSNVDSLAGADGWWCLQGTVLPAGITLAVPKRVEGRLGCQVDVPERGVRDTRSIYLTPYKTY